MKKILVVEDDVLLGKTLCYNLTLAGYTADAALSSNSARIQFENNDYDLFVLDVNLPDGNGFDLCRDIKARYENAAVIFLTANDMESDMIKGFELGADDYVTKPFPVNVFQRKVAALFNRIERQTGGDYYDDGNLFIDFASMNAMVMLAGMYGLRLSEILGLRWLKELENASAKVHISRLEALMLEMQQTVERLFGNRLDEMDALMRKIYADGYYHTAFEVQRGFNVGWDLAPLNRGQLERVTAKPWALDGEAFSGRIWKQRDTLVSTLHSEMTRVLLRGDTPDKAIEVIAKGFDVSRSQAARLVMTETAYFASEAQKDCYNVLGVERFEIIATLDYKTSTLCQDMDGRVVATKDSKAGVTAPPFHPRCRSCTAPYFEDSYGERAARGADGKTYYVPSDMKYGEWFEKHVKSDPDELGGYLAARATKEEKGLFEKYGAVFGEEMPESLEGFLLKRYNDGDWWDGLKGRKQAALNGLDYTPKFDNIFGNGEVRRWYVAHDRKILDLVDSTQTLEAQARQAHALRNMYREQARKMMQDRTAADLLGRTEKSYSFDELLKHKELKYGLTGEAAHIDILRSAGVTRESIDERYLPKGD